MLRAPSKLAARDCKQFQLNTNIQDIGSTWIAHSDPMKAVFCACLAKFSLDAHTDAVAEENSFALKQEHTMFQ